MSSRSYFFFFEMKKTFLSIIKLKVQESYTMNVVKKSLENNKQFELFVKSLNNKIAILIE